MDARVKPAHDVERLVRDSDIESVSSFDILVLAKLHRSRGVFRPRHFGRCAFGESPRARGTPGVRWTHGPRCLATPKRNGDLGRGRRPDVVETASPPSLQRPARGV